MSLVSAEQFWTEYREALRETNWEGYSTTKVWTRTAINAAKRSIGRLGLKTEVGYNTCVTTLLDAVGYEWRHCYDWTIRVGFEHEMKLGDWKRELCKLTHVVADLRVLVAYHNAHGRSDAQERFQDHVDKLGIERMKLGGPEWLLVMGPSICTASEPYRAFTLEAGGRVTSIADDNPVVPSPFQP